FGPDPVGLTAGRLISHLLPSSFSGFSGLTHTLLVARHEASPARLSQRRFSGENLVRAAERFLTKDLVRRPIQSMRSARNGFATPPESEPTLLQNRPRGRS